MAARAPAPAPAAAAAGRDRRGLTLIELLLVIGLLVALGAVVLPVVDRRLDEQTFETTGDLLTAQLRLARFHAAATGRPVAVSFVADPARIEATFFDTGGEKAAQGDPARDLRIHESWALRPLPEGTSIGAERNLVSFSVAEKETPSFRLAVYLPDGSALAGEPAWVWDEGGRLARIGVNRWTGGSSWERVEPSFFEAPGLQGEEETP